MASALAAAAPARSAETFQSWSWYLGDLHSHTGWSGDAGSQETGCSACGAQADLIATAQANGLDFVAFTDHVNGVKTESGAQFKAMLSLAAENTVDDAFVVLPAAEVYFQTASGKLGHKSILLFADDATLSTLEIKDVRPVPTNPLGIVGSCDGVDKYMTTLSASFGDALALPHHPAATLPTPTDWSCHFDAWEPAVEVDSVHGNSLSASLAWEPLNKGVTSTGYADQAIDPEVWGYTLGFVGGTDRHDAMPGEVCKPDQGNSDHIYGGALTIVALPTGATFDRAAIYDAIVSRHTEATSGPMIPVDVRYSVDGADVGGFGDDVEVREDHDLTVTVSVPPADASYVTGVTLQIPGDDPVTLDAVDASTWSATLASADVPAVAYAQVELDGASWWPSGCDDNDGGVEYVWPSPSRFTVVPVDDDHDGVSVAEGDCDDGDPRRFPGAAEIWYDGVDEDCLGGDDDDADGDGVDSDVVGGPDCDDQDPATFPGAPDVPYDGLVNDCDVLGEYDADGDGFTSADFGGDDCDDADPDVHPGAWDEPYDGVIADCDASDELDADVDGHDAAPWGDDCDDADPDVFPGAAEAWYDGVDEDCDGRSDFDADGDGHDTRAVGGDDCDDADPAAWPGAPDAPYDGVVTDCDARDELDADLDGHDALAVGGDDCDDASSLVHPGAVETWYDGIDADCDGGSDFDADRDGDEIAPRGDDCDDHDPTVQACDTGHPVVDPHDRPDPADVDDSVDDSAVVTPPPAGRPCGCDTGGASPLAGLGVLIALVRRRQRGARAHGERERAV